MRTSAQKLRSFLDDHRVRYEAIQHSPDFTAQETAAHTHTPGREFAKTVILRTDGGHAMAVLPAHHRLDLAKARDATASRSVRLASEPEMDHLCPDCETGAAPPFGNLYGMPVVVSPVLAMDEWITFNAGTHQDAVRMKYADYAKLVEPRVADLSLIE